MRKGQNPAKFVKDVARPERITVALLNYIPFLSGFYTETLDVLKVCMESMRKDAGLPFEIAPLRLPVAFGVIFVFLLVRPQGLFGRAVPRHA